MPEEKNVTFLTITMELEGFHNRSDEDIKAIITWLNERPNVVFAELEELEHDSYVG